MKKRLIFWMIVILCLAARPACASHFAWGGSRTPAPEAGARMTTSFVQDAELDMTVARCLAPAGYIVRGQTEWGGPWQSVTAPARVCVTATSPDERVVFTYLSPVSYLHTLAYSLNGVSYARHVDGALDTQTMTPMLSFREAGDYADYIVCTLFPEAEVALTDEAKIAAEEQALLDGCANALYEQACALFSGNAYTKIDGSYFACAERTYSLEWRGERCRATVCTLTEGLQMTTRMTMAANMGEFVSSMITWDAPFCYVFLAPEAEYDANRKAFDLFTLNTTVSDEFLRACRDLTNQLLAYVTGRNCQSMASVRDYCLERMGDALEDSGSGSYSYEEDWSDAIYGRNDYTLESGDHVKVSVAYDYVYGDEYGNVYATDSALDEPAGMTRLTPN